MKINKTYILLAALAIVVFTVTFYQKYKNRIDYRSDCLKEFKTEAHGIVENAFFDENPEDKGYVIKFTNGASYRPRFLTKWQSIDLKTGDSLFKKSGSFRVTILEKGILTPIIIEDTIDCDNLK